MLSHCIVRWNDGSHDNQRKCSDCGSVTCSEPVYKDFYKEIVTKKSYWEWAKENLPQNGSGGAEELSEPQIANPDTLEAKDNEIER